MEIDELGALPQPVSGMLAQDLDLTKLPDAMLAYVVSISRVQAARAENALLASIDARRGVFRTFDTVREFRKNYLPEGHLLTADAVGDWIFEQARRDGEASWWFMDVWVQPEQILREERDGVILEPETKLRFEPPVAWTRQPAPGKRSTSPMEHRYVEYATPSSPHNQQAVRAEGVLDWLRLLSLNLELFYGWTRAQGTTFVLTGLIPIASAFANKLISERGRRPRAMSLKHMQLAAFTAEHEGESLAVRMTEWNERFPDWAYNTVTHFGGDSALALRRATGGHL